MQNEFSFFELKLIHKECVKRSAAAIAEIIDRPVEDVIALIKEHCRKNNLTCYDQLCADKLVLKQKKVGKRKQRIELAKKNNNRFKDQEKLASRQIVQQQFQDRKARRNGPAYKTLVIDYSQLISVRIDNKTVIYVKPGQDIEAIKKKYCKPSKTY